MATIYPALIISFARKEGLERLVTASLNAGIKKIYVAIDGPKNDIHLAVQSKMRSFLENIQNAENIEVQIWQREKNLGAAVGVLTAINWFFRNEEAGYILEDDLVPSTDFFSFAGNALERYRDQPEIWLIAGSRMNPEKVPPLTSEWSHYPMIWGWATWSDRWNSMYAKLTENEQPSLRSFFDKRVNFWSAGAFRAQRGLVDAWDIPLACAQSRENRLTVIPPVNLVSNIGFDMNATHTSGEVFPLNHPVRKLTTNYQLSNSLDHKLAQDYDRLLERKLFKIKFHHSFLRIYAPILDFFKSRKPNRGGLKFRLDKVIFPD